MRKKLDLNNNNNSNKKTRKGVINYPPQKLDTLLV